MNSILIIIIIIYINYYILITIEYLIQCLSSFHKERVFSDFQKNKYEYYFKILKAQLQASEVLNIK